MKKLLLLSSFILLNLFYLTAQNVSVNEKGFLIKKVNISDGWLLSACTEAIGTGAREKTGYNYTHTYDNKGIVLFEKVDNKVRTGTLNEVQFHFYVPEANSVTPDKTFSGSVTIEKLKVNKSTSASDVKNALTSWALGDSYTEHNYRYSNNGIYIYFQFNEAETELNKISIGPDKR